MLISAAVFAVVTALALLIAFINLGYLSPIYVFNANFIAGGIITFMGVYSLLSPSARFGGGLTGGSRALDFNMHERLKNLHRQDEPMIVKFIYVGVGVILITVLAQYLLSLI